MKNWTTDELLTLKDHYEFGREHAKKMLPHKSPNQIKDMALFLGLKVSKETMSKKAVERGLGKAGQEALEEYRIKKAGGLVKWILNGNS